MKSKVVRMFGDFEKEEKWLNEMSAKGLQLVSVSPPQYVFEEGEPGEYIYRLELLENHPSGPEGRAYIRFIEEAGIECVDTYWRWAYLRRKTVDGPFDVYTDYGSKIKHYRRIAIVEGVGALFNAGVCAFDIGALHLPPFVFALNAIIAILFGYVTLCHYKKIRKLKEAMRVRE